MADATKINAPKSGGSSSGAFPVVTPLGGPLHYVWTPPDGSLIDFGEYGGFKSDGNTGIARDLPVEYAREVDLIRALAQTHFGESTQLSTSEDRNDTGQPELVLAIRMKPERADLPRWNAFHRDVLKAIPRGRMNPIVLRPDPQDADQAT